MYRAMKKDGAVMSLVSQSYLELVRARKNLHKASIDQDWAQLREADETLGDALNSAFDDDHRNPIDLVQEMERIVRLYAEIVESLPQDAAESLKAFPRLQP